jgi:hypothetical protein
MEQIIEKLVVTPLFWYSVIGVISFSVLIYWINEFIEAPKRKKLKEQQQQHYLQQRNELTNQCWEYICKLGEFEKLGINTSYTIVTLFRKTKNIQKIDSINKLSIYDNNELNTISISKYQEYILTKKIVDKYKKEDVEKILDATPWEGMSVNQLIDMKEYSDKFAFDFLQYSSLSQPTNIERSNKNKDEFVTVIYGNKNVGSYYKFKNNELFDWVEREGY